jgi:pyrroloquinoline quinone biosynthesis protein E
MVVAPNGDVLPCQAASTIPGPEFPNVRDHPLEWVWSESDAFARFRETDWMQEPCRTCPLGWQEVDWGGYPCQALRLAGRCGGDGSGLPVLAPSRARRRGA